jgi:predicted transcriptional regulator
LFREEILENEYRRKIFEFIKHNPGLHFRELQRQLQISLSTLDYHLDYLVRKGILSREEDGYYTRFYDVRLTNSDKKILKILRQKRMREILLITLSKVKVKYQMLLDDLSIPPSTLSFYLKRLVDLGILLRHQIGRESMYTIADEETLSRLLMIYRTSFVDKLIDKTLATWMEIR